MQGFGDLSGKMLDVQSSQRTLAGSLAELQGELQEEMAGLRKEISRQTGIVGEKLQGIEDGLAFVCPVLHVACDFLPCIRCPVLCRAICADRF